MLLITQEIPRDKWPTYLLDLSLLHPGWRVSVEVLERAVGDQRTANGLPLQGFSFETQGGKAGDILIEVGDLPSPFVTHHVDRPRTLRVADTQPGLETALQIECEDGSTTLVLLRCPRALPAC